MNFVKRFELINAVTTPEFNAITLAEYWDARNADFEEFMGCASQVEDYVLAHDDPESQDVEQYVDELILAQGWNPAGTFQVNFGTVSIRDYLIKVGLSAIDGTSEDVVPLDGIGQATAPISIEEVGQQAIDDWVSGVATAAFLRQLDQSKTVADRLTGFEAEMTSKISSDSQNVSATLAYYKAVLQTKPTPAEALQYVSSALSLEQQADEESADVPENSSFSDMTGASPVGPLNFDGVANAVSSVCKVGAAVVSSAIKAVVAGAEWLFGWIGEQANAIFVDPIDLESLGSANDGTVQGYCWNAPDGGERYVWVDEAMPTAPQIISKAMEEWNDHPYRVFKTAFGTLETNVSLSSVTFSASGDACFITPSDGWNVMSGSAVNFRPTVFNARKLATAWAEYLTAKGEDPSAESWTLNYDSFMNCLKPLVHEGGLLDTKDLSEADLYRALIWSKRFFNCLDQLLQGQSDAVVIPNVMSLEVPSMITNADFLLAVSGRYINEANEVVLAESSATGVPFVMCAFMQQLIRTSNPLNWPYFAYSTSTSNKPVPGWRIKTDTENKAVANNFIVSAIIAVVVIAIAIYVGVKVKGFARKLAWKREQTIATVQSKMWAGEALTPKEMKKYQRAVKKGGVASLFASAQSGVPSPSSGNSDAAISIIHKTITGEPL